MRWEAWVLVVVFVLNEFLLVGRIGRRRPTITPLTAMWGLVEFGFYVWLVLRLAGVA